MRSRASCERRRVQAVLVRKRTAAGRPKHWLCRMLNRITQIKRRAATFALAHAMCVRNTLLCEKAALRAADDIETKLRLKAKRATFLYERRLEQERVDALRNLDM